MKTTKNEMTTDAQQSPPLEETTAKVLKPEEGPAKDEGESELYHPARQIATNVQSLYVDNLSRENRETINKGVEGVLKMTPDALKQALFFFTAADTVNMGCDNIDAAFNTVVKSTVGVEKVRTAMELGENSVQKVLDAKKYTAEVVEQELEKLEQYAPETLTDTVTATCQWMQGNDWQEVLSGGQQNIWGGVLGLYDYGQTTVSDTVDYVVETKDWTVDKVAVTSKFVLEAKDYVTTTEISTIQEDATRIVGETVAETQTYIVDTKDSVMDACVPKIEDSKQYIYSETSKTWNWTTEQLNGVVQALNDYLPIAINNKNKEQMLTNVHTYYSDVAEKVTVPTYEGCDYVRKQGVISMVMETPQLIFHATGVRRDEKKYGPVVNRMSALVASIFNVRVLIATGGDDG